MQTEKKSAVFSRALVWLIIVYCMKGRVTCYIKMSSYGFMSPIRYYINMSQSCVKLYVYKIWHKHRRGDVH